MLERVSPIKLILAVKLVRNVPNPLEPVRGYCDQCANPSSRSEDPSLSNRCWLVQVSYRYRACKRGTGMLEILRPRLARQRKPQGTALTAGTKGRKERRFGVSSERLTTRSCAGPFAGGCGMWDRHVRSMHHSARREAERHVHEPVDGSVVCPSERDVT